MSEYVSVYREDGRWVFRASSFGNCDANLVRTALGMTPELPPDALQDAMDRSSSFEQPILKRFKAEGFNDHKFKLLDEFDVQMAGYGWGDNQPEVEIEGPGWVIRCHPDAIGELYQAPISEREQLGDRRVIEVKALKKVSASMLEKASYRWQFSIEMVGSKLPGLVVVGWKDDETGALTDEPLTIATMDRPPFSYGLIRRRANMLVEKIEAKDLECTVRQWPCGYYQEHDKETGVWAEQVTEVANDQVKYWGIRYADADKREKDAKKDREMARNRIIENLKAASDVPPTPGKYRAGPVKFEYVASPRAGKVDYRALKPETLEDLNANRGKGYMTEYVQGVEVDG